MLKHTYIRFPGGSKISSPGSYKGCTMFPSIRPSDGTVLEGAAQLLRDALLLWPPPQPIDVKNYLYVWGIDHIADSQNAWAEFIAHLAQLTQTIPVCTLRFQTHRAHTKILLRLRKTLNRAITYCKDDFVKFMEIALWQICCQLWLCRCMHPFRPFFRMRKLLQVITIGMSSDLLQDRFCQQHKSHPLLQAFHQQLVSVGGLHCRQFSGTHSGTLPCVNFHTPWAQHKGCRNIWLQASPIDYSS